MDTNASFSIRRAEPTDVHRHCRRLQRGDSSIQTATFDTEPKSVDDRAEWLQSHDDRHPVFLSPCWTAEWSGGQLLSRWLDRRAYEDTVETSFYVHSSCRGRGIGRKLKEAIVEEARRLRYHTLLARVAEGSEESIHSTRRQVLSTSARSRKSDASSANNFGRAHHAEDARLSTGHPDRASRVVCRLNFNSAATAR